MNLELGLAHATLPAELNVTAKIIATVAVVLGGLTFLMFGTGSDETEFYVHVNKVMAQPAKWEGKNLQVHGFAVPGSIEEQIVDQKAHREFDLEYCGQRIHVRHAGSKPDTFKEQAETVVKGTLVRAEGQGPIVLQAVEGEQGISAKCPSKYEANREPPKCD